MRRVKQVVAMLLVASMSISLLSTEVLAARDNSKQSVTDEVMEQELLDNQAHGSQATSNGQIVDELNHQFGAKGHYHDVTVTGDASTCKNRAICSG